MAKDPVCGMDVNEAQAAGKPIITTRHADIPEIVVPGQSALLVPSQFSQGRCTRTKANPVAVSASKDRWTAIASLRAFDFPNLTCDSGSVHVAG